VTVRGCQEATQCNSGPEIGTPAWINPTRRAVIKQAGMFWCTVTGGENWRGKDKEREAENGSNQPAVGPVTLPYDSLQTSN